MVRVGGGGGGEASRGIVVRRVVREMVARGMAEMMVREMQAWHPT